MNRYQLEKHRIVHGFNRAAAAYDKEAVLPQLIQERLLERLDYLRLDPAFVADMGSGTGAGTEKLGARYPNAEIAAIDFSAGMIDQVTTANSRIKKIHSDAIATPLPDQCIDLIFSNLMLPWCHDLDAVLAEFRRLMAPRGALSFSTFGPDTLMELRRAWRKVDEKEHVHAFFDMHDVGDALTRAGFAEPVMDVERLTLTYKSLTDLLRDLRYMGSLNALPDRPRGLMGRSQLRQLQQAYDIFCDDNVLPATFEIIYAQAWVPAPSSTVAFSQGETRFPLSKIGRRGNDD